MINKQPVIPYEKDHNAREAVRLLLLSSTPEKIRNEIVQRMQISGKFIVPLLPLIFNNLHNKSSILQDVAFGLAKNFEDQGYNLSHIAADIASHLSSPSTDLRETAKNILINMKEAAKPAEDFALGCLRNGDKNIIITGLEILLAINTAISRSISPRISATLEAHPHDKQIADLAQKLINLISNTGSTSIANSLSGVDISVFKGREALIIDDNFAFRQTIGTALKNLGMKVMETDSGQTGIKLVKEKSASLSRYDLIVIEVKLPDINGVQVIRNARALPMFSETAIAVISNVNNDRIIMAARGSGANEYILKSTGLGITLKLLANLLAGLKG